MTSKISIVSFNLHGLQQGVAFLTDLCRFHDIIFIQEHWLLSCDLYKLEVNDDFVVYSSSAMDSVISRGVLRGRPFGGVGILIRKSLSVCAKVIAVSIRYIIITVGDIIFCNVYMPCHSSMDYETEFVDTLARITSDLSILPKNLTVVGGDFNSSFHLKDKSSGWLEGFCSSLSIHRTDHLLPPSHAYSFHNSNYSSVSLIDHFLISYDLFQCVESLTLLDSGINFSDHLPINLSFCPPPSFLTSLAPTSDRAHIPDAPLYKLRWDKANLQMYYNMSFLILSSAPFPPQLTEITPDKEGISALEIYYAKIIAALKKAALIAVPHKKSSYFKHWWDEELNNAKSRSIDSFRAWVDRGKPRNGCVFNDMTRCKRDYKALITHKKLAGQTEFSNNLHESLNNKEPSQFWKCWKSKLGKKTRSPMVDGSCDSSIIANKFATFFSEVYKKGDSVRSAVFSSEFEGKFKSYVGDPLTTGISVELVDQCIHSLHRGAAAGVDGIAVEHLLFCHPIIVVLISLIFNTMLRWGYVPNDFSQGLTFPLLKGSGVDGSILDNYRGITVSCLMSKLFEICLRQIFAAYLTSSDLQFGFKKSMACRDAIFTAHSVVDFYNTRGSTVNACALDLSKAFDKVNHCCLFLKLMARHCPRCFIATLQEWYSKCSTSVKWGDFVSLPFNVTSGVRQGGILSPCLFAIYIDDLHHRLEKSGFGCCIGYVYCGCILYADDILLLASSVIAMQSMLDICFEEMRYLDMCFNIKKCMCIRIGPRFNAPCAPLTINGDPIAFVECIKYLGVFLQAGRRFLCSLAHAKLSFYRAFNALFSKSKFANSELISVFLLKSYCLPLLTYAIEASFPSKRGLQLLDNIIDNAVRKIFNVKAIEHVLFIRQMVYLPPMGFVYHKAFLKMYRYGFTRQSPVIASCLRVSSEYTARIMGLYNSREESISPRSVSRTLNEMVHCWHCM